MPATYPMDFYIPDADTPKQFFDGQMSVPLEAGLLVVLATDAADVRITNVPNGVQLNDTEYWPLTPGVPVWLPKTIISDINQLWAYSATVPDVHLKLWPDCGPA